MEWPLCCLGGLTYSVILEIEGISSAAENETKIYSDDELSEIIDETLRKVDINMDGMIDYAEYTDYRQSGGKS